MPAPALSRAFGIAAQESTEAEASVHVDRPRLLDLQPGPVAIALDAGIARSHRPVRGVMDPEEVRARVTRRECEARGADLRHAVAGTGRARRLSRARHQPIRSREAV